MIEAIYSVMFFLMLLFGILLLDESFLAIQTTETAHFFALRSHLVDKDIQDSERFFTRHILQNFVFDEKNDFFEIGNIQTHKNHEQIETSITFQLKQSGQRFAYGSKSIGLEQP